jgi:hypothetical protein
MTRLMTMQTRSWLLAVALLLGCGAEAPVPDKPTWVDDVKPIFQANCFHCHGANANFTKFGNRRWDVYDLNKPEYMALGFMTSEGFLGASDQPAHTHQGLVGLYVKDTGAGRMPPPPATPLGARDIEVLDNWSKTGFTEGQHAQNNKPTIAWLQKPKRYQVLDADDDQVLGQLDCGGTMFPIPRSGGLDLPADATPPCTATLFDGFEQVTAELK